MNTRNMSVGVLRPEARAESNLKPGKGEALDPGSAVQHVLDDLAVHPSEPGNLSQAPVVDGGPQVNGESAHHLSHGVSTCLVGPSGTTVAGRIPSIRPGHDGNVREPFSDSERALPALINIAKRTVVRSWQGGENYPHLAQEFVIFISRFEPNWARKHPVVWAEMADELRSIIGASEPRTWTSATKRMSVLAEYGRWLVVDAGLDFSEANLFEPTLWERWLDSLTHVVPHTKGDYRTHLQAVAVEIVGPQMKSYRHKQFERSSSPEPLSLKEQASVLSLPGNQATEHRAKNLACYIGLAMGSGATSGEVAKLRQRDVEDLDGGLLLHFDDGERKVARSVPLLASMEPLVRPMLKVAAPDEFVFLPGRTGKFHNVVTNFLQSCNDITVMPNNWRLRATWMVSHLDAGTPLPDLMEAVGHTNMSKFERFLPFLARLDESVRFDAMRLAGGSR